MYYILKQNIFITILQKSYQKPGIQGRKVSILGSIVFLVSFHRYRKISTSHTTEGAHVQG